MYDAFPILIAFFWCWVWFSTVFVGLSALDFVGKYGGASWFKRSPLWWTVRVLWLVLLAGGILGMARVAYLLPEVRGLLGMLGLIFGVAFGVCFFMALRVHQTARDNSS